MRIFIDPKHKEKKAKKKEKVQIRNVPHKARYNPIGLKWRLVLLLTKGELEVVPLLPRRAIEQNETLIVRLGDEGAYNTVEVEGGSEQQ